MESHDRFHSEYEDITLIGRGGFGTVYKARNKLDKTYYAIKQIKLFSDKSKNVQVCLRYVINSTRFLCFS